MNIYLNLNHSKVLNFFRYSLITLHTGIPNGVVSRSKLDIRIYVSLFIQPNLNPL